MNGSPSVAVVGGGILGMTAAYRLAQQGVRVALYERSPDLGGLVGSFEFDGHAVDRFYHVILPTDDRVRGLAEELGLGDRFRFRPTRVGFYADGRLFSMTSPKELLTFPLLPPLDRVRLGAFVARCQLTKDYTALDRTPLLEWLRRRSGARALERMWAPLLDSKFDGHYDDLPATYIWARTRRMSKTRDRSGAEVMGWLEGGYQTLIDALERKIVELGGEIHAGRAVEQIVGSNGAATGLVVEGAFRPFDFVLCTLAPPMAPPPARARAAEARTRGPLPLPRSGLPPAADAPEHQPLLPPQHHRPAGAADDDRRDDARRRPRRGRRPSGLRLQVRRPVLAAARAAGRRASSASSSATRGRSSRTCADEDILASVVQRARVTEPVHTLGGAEKHARNVLDPGGGARVDRPRLPGDRQRAGGDRGRRAGPAGRLRATAARRRGRRREGAHRRCTGAAGFVGSHVCELLLADGHEVVGVDDLSYGSVPNIALFLDDPRFEFQALDCTRQRELRRAFAGCDAIVHLAAKKIPRFGGTLATLRVNSKGMEAACAVALSLDADLDLHLDVRRLRQRHAALSPRTTTLVIGPPTIQALGLCRLEDVRRALRARARRRARAADHDPAAVQCLRAAQPPQLVGRPGGRRSSSRCWTASRWRSTVTAGRRGRSRTCGTPPTASCARSSGPRPAAR